MISGFVVAGTAPKLLLIRAVGPSLSQFKLSGLLQRPTVKIYSGATLVLEAPAGSRIPSMDTTRMASQLGGAFALPDSSSDTVIVQSFKPGAYTVQVAGEGENTGISIVEVYDLDPSNPECRLVNLSTRAVVGRNSEILIPGVYVAGSSPRQFLFRAVGPGLTQWNVDNTLARPKIALYRGSTKIAQNTGWSSDNAAGAIAEVSGRVGAFPLARGSADSALLVTLAPGAYTLHISGADGGAGVVLAEIYESSNGGSSIESDRSDAPTRRIFGHYMGCFAAGTGAIQYHATLGLEELRVPSNIRNDRSLLAAHAANSFSSTYRNFALAPQDSGRTLLEAAELEIKRAMRIGLDGFTFDAWAGGKSARDLLDAMFTVCETQDLPFQLTVSLDTTVLNDSDPDLAAYPGNVWEKTLHWLLDKHGDSPKLARRNGKVMIMGYQSIWPGIEGIYKYVDAQHPEYTAEQRAAAVFALRRTQQGWALIADRYAQMEASLRQEIFWQFDMFAFFEGAGGEGVTEEMWVDAATYLATRFPALGMFHYHRVTPAVADAVVASGSEWSPPQRLQYENYGWYQTASPGLDWVRSDWENLNEPGRTLVQFITWNDYHENTNLSPGYNTRYAYYDLTGEYIRAWKAGGVPVSADRDKVYIFSHKYAHNTPMFPFKALSRADNEIEIVTILPTAAKFRSPGRQTTLGESVWDAPAGMSYKRLPLTVGPVTVEWSRDNFVSDINTLVLPDPVSDRPFRQDTGKVAISTEEAAHWALDFPGKPMFIYSEYADDDGDGLPNWFEMLWYGKWGMMNTATVADPHADPNGTGKTNLQHFLDQTDPYKK